MDRDVRADLKDELGEVLTDELRRIKEKLTEIKVQIDQTTLVVDREQMRNSDIATELRTLQENIETVPRQDIRTKYDEALDARFRLTTMRGQLEKFQAAREQLEHEQVIFARILKQLHAVGALGSLEDSFAQAPVNMNIVRVIQAQEEERQRLARQMHDGPAQSLTNFILQAEICQRLFDRNPARAAEELVNLKDAASITFQKVRDFIFDLRPMMLDDLGIVPTVRRYVDSFREKNDIEVRLDVTGEERRLESYREVMIFRALQELLGLARDYSTPSQIAIKLDLSGARVRISVEDDGRGFDPQVAFNADNMRNDPRIQGLVTLKEKFELIRGKVEVDSNETDGTLIRLELPVSDKTA